MNAQFNDALTKKLKANNLSVTQFEKMAGLKRNSIQHILNGHTKRPDLNTLISIAKTLHCTIDELVSDEKSNDNSQPSQQKIFKQKKVLKIENFTLLTEIESFALNFLKNNNITPYAEVYFEAIKEIYYYCMSGEGQKFDERFAEWVVTNRF